MELTLGGFDDGDGGCWYLSLEECEVVRFSLLLFTIPLQFFISSPMYGKV